jgi:uncharacterized membrane protein
MPNEENPDGDPTKPNEQSGVELDPSIKKYLEALVQANNASTEESTAKKIEADVRAGERWLVGVGIASVVVNVIIAFIYYGQLTQMRVATEASTKATQVAADALDLNSGQFDRMMRQAIHQTIAQIHAAQGSVNGATAAKSAATTAKETLHVSERAYVSFGSPEIDVSKKGMSIPFTNSGHIPSGRVDIALYQATFNVPSPTIAATSFNYIVQRSLHKSHFNFITPGEPLATFVPLPDLSGDKLNNGLQLVMIVGTATYNDGFMNTPQQTLPFCMRTVYQLLVKRYFVAPCDAGVELPKFETLDWSKDTDTW